MTKLNLKALPFSCFCERKTKFVDFIDKIFPQMSDMNEKVAVIKKKSLETKGKPFDCTFAVEKYCDIFDFFSQRNSKMKRGAVDIEFARAAYLADAVWAMVEYCRENNRRDPVDEEELSLFKTEAKKLEETLHLAQNLSNFIVDAG